MKKLTKKITSAVIAAVMAISPSAVFADDTGNTEAALYDLPENYELAAVSYTADFTKLIKNGAQTEYGTADDKNITIDEYTTADLSYAGTYVTADGKVYIKSGTVCNKNGNYAKGSHISFTAPSDGKLVVTGADIGWFEGDTYGGYNANIEIDAKEGVTYHFGYRKDSTYIGSLTFTATVNPSIADGYESVTDGVLPYVVSKPEKSGEYPLVVFLHSAKRNGSDNVSQLNDVKYLFDILKNKAVLAAPQTADMWSSNTLNAFVAELEVKYSPSSVVIAGQDEGADAAYSVADADKIIAIGGTENTAAAETAAKVWAFANNNDANIAAIRNAVNAMQSGGADVLYTEFPYSTDGTAAEQASKTAGLTDWILNDIKQSKTVDLVLFAGQSNMAGRGDYADATPVMPYHGFEYHPVTEPGVLTTITEPFGKYENNDTVNDNSGQGVDRRSGDMVSAFIESYYETSGVPAVGVQCSRGGTGTDYWRGAVLTEAANRYNEAETYLTNAGYTVGKKILVWCQGCTDADKNRSDDTYKTNTRTIFNTIKSSTGITDVFMIRIGHCKTSGAAAIDEAKDPVYKRINLAQKALADANDDITAVASFYTDEYAVQMRDQYHYHQGAYNSIGKIAGNNTAVTLYNTGEWTQYPEPDEVVETPAPETPKPVDAAFEITSSDASIDVSGMKNYGTDTYRVYKTDGSFETVTAANGKIANTTGGEVVVVPEYKFEFTNQTNPTDANIKGYVKVGQNSYTAEKGYGLSNSDYHINQNGCLAKKDDNNPIKIDLADGFYDITLYRLGGGRADIYANGKLIANNTTSNTSQNRGGASALMEIPSVKLADGTTDITFGNLSGNNERIASLKIARVPEKFRKPVIWIAGDSEAANYYPIDADGDDLKSNKIMITGFGQQLGKLMSDKYSVSNYGQPSATVKTWYDECFESVNGLMQKGDTILIDFGINEVASSSNKLTIEQMKEHITTIVNAAKEKGVTPILISPVYNGKYQSKAYFTYNASTKTNTMTAFADDLGIQSIDLNKWTQLYANAQTGDSAWLTNNYHVSDNLHLTQHSAVLAASFIAAQMEEMGYETTDFADAYTDISSIGEGNVRGDETENKREYSVAAAKAFMADGTITKPTDTPEPTNTPNPTNTPEPSDTPSPADTPKPDGTPKPSDAPEYPVTVSYDAQSKKLTLTASGETANAVVIKATYDGDKMSDVKIYPAEFADNTAVIENIEAGENDRIFVWNSTEYMEPLAPVFTAADAPEITQKPTEKPTADPDLTPKEYVYRQDFEGSDAQNGWTSPAGTLEVKSDPTSGIDKYMTVVSGKSGTCRSGYVEMADAVNQSFVFECDYKSTSNVNVSDLELLEGKASVYANHGRYSNAKYAFTMARPMGSDLYVINNGADDSGFKLESYADPVFKSKEIAGNPWLHVKVVGDMENHTATAYITSLDGQTEYYHGMTDMSPDLTSWKCIHLLSPSTGADTCIDNIEIYKARESDLSPQYHKVKITCKAYSFEQYVLDGESVVNIPDVSSYGQSFDGWNLGGKLYSSAELAGAPITSDCEIVGQISAGYIEAMAGVEFNSFPAGNEIVMGADENTYGSNPISLTITGEQGTSLVTNPDSRVTDFNVEWTFDGFRTLDGRPTGETTTYCESYGAVEMTAEHNTAVDFKMKKTAGNYYGRVTAVVTYNGKTMSVSRPLLILGTKSNEYMLPKPGYTADYDKYENTLVGYKAEQNDLLLGGWESYGSDSTSAELKSDSTGKYLSISRAAIGNSSAVYNRIGDITAQTVFEQDIRFGNDGAVSYVGGGTMTEPASTAFTFEKSGTAMKFNGTAISGVTAAADKWYHIVIHADPTSKKCFAKVYEKAEDYSAAQPIGQTAVMDFQTYTSGAAYRISPARTAGKSIDINNVKIYAAEIDESKMTVTAADTASIPSTVTLTASAKTEDGADAIGKFEWSIADELAEGVSIESTGDNTASLTVTDDATAGDVTVRASIGGKSVTKAIKLTGKAGISFTEAPAGIRLGGGEYTYKAVVMNADASVNSGAAVTYSLANAQGMEAEVSGVSIDSVSGKLTIGESVTPQTIYVKASSGGMTKLAKTTLYDLKFSFGTNAAASGFTAVPSAAAYSGSLGFGVEGGKESADGLTGGTFKLKLEKGKVYEVKATYSGTITCERIDSGFTGFTRTKDSMSADTYQVAIFGDDIMDISINGTLKSIEVTPVAKSKASKPDWWTIGDSTIQQNGSWAYTITGGADKTSSLSKYPELAAVISVFHNSGRAGRQHMSYYNEGLLNAVLCGMDPGDAVSISGMGTNDSSSTQAQFKAYDEMYMNAILDMGGYVILGSYTPSGNYGATEGKVYDADTMTFKGKRTNAYELAIRELYEENKDDQKVLGFLDIGQIADDKMTADVKAAYNGTDGDETAKRAAADAKAAEMMAWWKDYNHYYVDFSNYILPDLTKAAAELIGKIS